MMLLPCSFLRKTMYIDYSYKEPQVKVYADLTLQNRMFFSNHFEFVAFSLGSHGFETRAVIALLLTGI